MSSAHHQGSKLNYSVRVLITAVALPSYSLKLPPSCCCANACIDCELTQLGHALLSLIALYTQCYKSQAQMTAENPGSTDIPPLLLL
jgi:hypothetical protein